MKYVELFAGAGGLGMGLDAAGFEHIQSFEWDDAPFDVLKHSGKDATQLDLKDIASTIFSMTDRPDCIVGGPPCQDFSKIGARKLGENARMTPIFALTICAARPEWFLFENVDRAPFSSSYRAARRSWKRAGYGLTEMYINCAHYGVPQSRKRFICIGRLHEQDGFLESAIRVAAREKPMTVRQMLDPKTYPEDAELLEKGAFFARPWKGGRGVRSIDETCPTIVRTTHEPPTPGYLNNRHPDDPIPAEKAHVLTLTQVARIQGFPHGYDFRRKPKKRAKVGWTDRQVNQMIANAVPAPTARIIGRCILLREINSSIPAIDPGFTEFLMNPPPDVDRKPISAAAAANVRSRLNRVRRMLEARTFDSMAMELGELEAHPDFEKLDLRQQSDLRSAVRLFHFYRKRFPRKSRFDISLKVPDFRSPPKKKKGKKNRQSTVATVANAHPREPVDLKKLNLNAGEPFERNIGPAYPDPDDEPDVQWRFEDIVLHSTDKV